VGIVVLSGLSIVISLPSRFMAISFAVTTDLSARIFPVYDAETDGCNALSTYCVNSALRLRDRDERVA
jgi:hypothetical protein